MEVRVLTTATQGDMRRCSDHAAIQAWGGMRHSCGARLQQQLRAAAGPAVLEKVWSFPGGLGSQYFTVRRLPVNGAKALLMH